MFLKEGRCATPSNADLFFSAYRQNTEPAERDTIKRETEKQELEADMQ